MGDGMTRTFESSVSYQSIIATRLSRRAALMGLASTAALAAAPSLLPKGAQAAAQSSLSFAELERIYDQTHHVASGYDAKVLIRWGDPIAKDVAFDPAAITANSQSKQFGYNCDFIGYMPLPVGSNNSEHGLSTMSIPIRISCGTA
jgi:secreted PhoX family phosphatase